MTKSLRVEITLHLCIPMPDGLTLAGRLYGQTGTAPLPIVLSVTPYGKDGFHNDATEYVSHGFGVVAVDCRGRGDSEGDFWPYVNEAADIACIVNWIADQPWCDGNVVMSGGSYSGMNQWWTAARKPAALRTIVPAAASFLGVDFPSRGGVHASYNLRWLTLVSGRTADFNLFRDHRYWFDVFARRYYENIAFAELPALANQENKPFAEWAAHAEDTGYWSTVNPSTEQFAAITIPVLTVGGLFDSALNGGLAFYDRHLAANSKSEHYIIVGPWDHGGTRHPRQNVGGVALPSQALIDMQRLHVAWYKWTLGLGPLPSLFADRCVYYVLGLDEWRHAPSLDAATTGMLEFHLASAGSRVIEPRGLLRPLTTADQHPLTFRYDPLDTRPGELYGTTAGNDTGEFVFLRDRTEALNLFGNGIAYETEQFNADILITGRPSAHLTIGINTPDTDFAAFLYVIEPDGKALLIGEDYVRASYCYGSTASPDIPRSYDFSFLFCSLLVKHLSRLQLVIKCPNSPLMQKNYNSAKSPMYETASDARTATVIVNHSADQPSVLRIPLGTSISERRVPNDHVERWLSR